MLTLWPSKTVPFCGVQSTGSLNLVSQKQTCDDSFAQALCLKVLEMANVRPIIEQEEENKAEVGILLFYRNSKECQSRQGSLKCWEISYAKNGVRFLSSIKEFKM